MKTCLTLIVLYLANFLNTTAQEYEADSLMAIGNYREALNSYRELDTTADNTFKMARAYVALGDTDQAINSYKQGLEMEPEAIRPRFELGRLYLRTSNVFESLWLFKQLNEEFPENATYLFYKGQAHEQLKSEDLAMDVYENVLKMDPDYRRARLELVPLLIQNRETGPAIKYCIEVLNENPDDIKFNSLIAQAYYHAKIYSKAIEHLERLFELGNDTEFNRRTLAISYIQDAQWQKGIENIQIFLEQYNDKDADLYFLKSKAHLRLQEYDEAQDAIEYAIMYKRPSIAQEYLQMASIMAAREDFKGTFETMQLAVKENAEDDVAAYQLVVAADRYFKDKKSILKYYERFLDKFGTSSDYAEIAESRANDLKKEIFMNIEK
ncbi:hypothetical protein AAU57_04715 [Nonlabens sp. YIK11]|uniref:tetratricopeptide repeat protein n=1 Tax=Nonlabens sp. YIK11 TaxID=1453349 RepID=UPI0006DC7150|nr:tetratricopeptide repeat protein [Nonlabens sp. YIK11]KQC32697.1 hypothetical protein AAU57_04715 [Nonlabens sp. YIK11]